MVVAMVRNSARTQRRQPHLAGGEQQREVAGVGIRAAGEVVEEGGAGKGLHITGRVLPQERSS